MDHSFTSFKGSIKGEAKRALEYEIVVVLSINSGPHGETVGPNKDRTRPRPIRFARRELNELIELSQWAHLPGTRQFSTGVYSKPLVTGSVQLPIVAVGNTRNRMRSIPESFHRGQNRELRIS